MLSLLLSFCLPLVSSRVLHPHRVTEPAAAAPGIGLHLTTSYATVAIRYENGTLDDLFRMDADAEYIGLMSRWSDATTKRNCSTPWESVQCKLARRGRDLNKWLGRPATPDVGILASFLAEIKSTIEDILHSPVTRVYPVFPILNAMDQEDIQDAIDFAGLEWLFAERRSYHITQETNAAYAGLGYGLCELWQDRVQCEREESQMSLEPVLFLDFDNASFAASLQGVASVYREYNIRSEVHLDLGWFDMPPEEVPRAKFLARIQEAIVGVGSTLVRPPSKIVLLGEFADDEDFRETVKAALWELEFDASIPLDATMMERGKPLMLAARGAAEMAGRAEYWNDRRDTSETLIVEL